MSQSEFYKEELRLSKKALEVYSLSRKLRRGSKCPQRIQSEDGEVEASLHSRDTTIYAPGPQLFIGMRDKPYFLYSKTRDKRHIFVTQEMPEVEKLHYLQFFSNGRMMHQLVVMDKEKRQANSERFVAEMMAKLGFSTEGPLPEHQEERVSKEVFPMGPKEIEFVGMYLQFLEIQLGEMIAHPIRVK